MICYLITFSLLLCLPYSSPFCSMLVPFMMGGSISCGVCCRSLQCGCLAKSWGTETLNNFRFFGTSYFFSSKNWDKAKFYFFSCSFVISSGKMCVFPIFEPFVLKITCITLPKLGFITCISVMLTNNIHSLFFLFYFLKWWNQRK